MHFFKITVKRKPFKDIVEYHDANLVSATGRVSYWVELHNVQSVKFERISQADYIRNTRPKD